MATAVRQALLTLPMRAAKKRYRGWCKMVWTSSDTTAMIYNGRGTCRLSKEGVRIEGSLYIIATPHMIGSCGQNKCLEGGNDEGRVTQSKWQSLCNRIMHPLAASAERHGSLCYPDCGSIRPHYTPRAVLARGKNHLTNYRTDIGL